MLNNPLQILGMLRNSNNPMAMIQQMFGSDPKFQQVMQLVKGKNSQQIEQFVRNMAKGQNIDLSQFGL